MKKSFIILLAAVSLIACGGRSGNKKGDTAGNEKQHIRRFEMPPMPHVLTTPEERGAWIADHYWDKFDFESNAPMDSASVEQAAVDYISILMHIPADQAESSIKKMLRSAEANPDTFSFFTDFYEKYLYDPNSPMRNEDLYIMVLHQLIASDKLDEYEKIRPEAHLKMALKNRVGEQANDFRFTLASGRTVSLYSIKSRYTLLFFNNPDCNACAEIIMQLQEYPNIKRLIDNGELTVAAVYPDEDLTAWESHRKDIPMQWLNGYDADQSLRDRELYDLKAIPTLYLLDKDKKVLIKDAADAYPVETFFAGNGI